MTLFERDVHLAAERGEPIPAADVLRLLATIDTLRGQLIAQTKGRFVPPAAYLCVVCGMNPIDAEGGFDTCASCAARI